MKRLMLLIIVLALGLFLLDRPGANSNPTNPLEYFFDVIMDKTISSSTPAKVVDLKGYKEFSLLARFEGKANQSFDFEIGFNQLTIYRETIKLNAQGWANFAKVYPVYAPNVNVVIYHPPSNTKVKMMIYAGH